MAATQQQALAVPGVPVAPRRILFHLAGQAHVHQSNAQGPHAHGSGGGGGGGGIGSGSAAPPRRAARDPQDSAPEVEQVPLPLTWSAPSKVGAGLSNLGNTCFLNSVLQCLTYTPPLAGYLLTGQHRQLCRVPGFCAVCSLEDHVRVALASSGKSIAPSNLVKNLRSISRTFRMWRQEDAHEYMRCLLESLLKCSLPSHGTSSAAQQERSFVFRIFGGRLRSQVKCTLCSHSSNTYDPFLDLSLDIVRTESLTRALSRFTAVEELDGENKYRCGHCKKKVRAEKNFTIDSAPRVLTIQFKRFSSAPGRFGKIDKKVEFGRTLDLKPYMSRKEGEFTYSLYGVLVHSGGSTHSGHYFCFVRTSSGIWHVLDDSRVRQVSESSVMDQKAYILFYIRDGSQKANIKAHPNDIELRKQLNREESMAQPPLEETGLRSGLDHSRTGISSEKCKARMSPDEPKVESILVEQKTDLCSQGASLQIGSVEGKVKLETKEVEAPGGSSSSEECLTQLDSEELGKQPASENCSQQTNTGDSNQQLGTEECSTQPGSEECSTSGYDSDEHVYDHQVKSPAAYIQLLQCNHRTRRLFLSRRTPHRARKRSFDADQMEEEPSDAVGTDVEGGMLEQQVLKLDLRKQNGESSRSADGGNEPSEETQECVASVDAAECPVTTLDKGAMELSVRVNGSYNSSDLGAVDMETQSIRSMSDLAECERRRNDDPLDTPFDWLGDGSPCLPVEPAVSNILPDKDCKNAASIGSSSQQNPLYGLDVPRWNESDETAIQVDALLSSHHKPMQKRLDEWDEEYDRGKLKKIKRRVEQGDGLDEAEVQLPRVNPFQEAASRK